MIPIYYKFFFKIQKKKKIFIRMGVKIQVNALFILSQSLYKKKIFFSQEKKKNLFHNNKIQNLFPFYFPNMVNKLINNKKKNKKRK